MGCAQSKKDEEVVAAPSNDDAAEGEAKDAKDEVAKEEKAPDEKPKPQIFAIMRNGHEVIRGAQRDVQKMVDKGKMKEAKALWAKMHKWADIHMKMEEGSGTDESPMGMFRLLDKNFENIAKEQGLYDDHVELNKLEEAVDAAFEKGDKKEIKEAFDAFAKANTSHLEKEESIMMPKIKEFIAGGHPMKKYMQEELLATVSDDQMEHFIKFANEILEKHSEGEPRVRVFDHALKAASTPEQWAKWDAWIKESLSKKSYKEVQDAIQA